MIYIGLDIGGTNIKGAFVTKEGKITHRFGFRVDYSKTQEEIISLIGDSINSALKEKEIEKEEVGGIGIGCPGSINSKTGICEYSNNLNWFDLPIVAMIEKATGIKAKISNDANVAMLGEAKFGVGKKYHNLVLLTLGTGVGGGLYLNDQLYEGEEGKGAELGHMVIDPDGKECTCGMKGCFEAYASATALKNMTQEAMEKHKDSLMWKQVEGDLSKANGITSFECSKKGDKAAMEVVSKYEDYLAFGIINYCNIFRPEAIILGGGVSSQKEYLTDEIEKRLKEKNYGFKRTPSVKVLVSNLGNDAGVLGAAALVM
ncbi:MAG: ROK family protein [Bacilli bacterium]|nr:ROK family protein [Bacilli bacterium]